MPYSKPATESLWMRVAEVAGELGCKPATVLCWVRDGRLPVRAIRFGVTTRINREDFRKEMDRRARIGLSA